MEGRRRRQLKMSLDGLVRDAIWATMDHRQGAKPNILLFASRRGGSTWAMELLAANRGTRALNQPFTTLHHGATLSQMYALPRMHLGEITSLDQDAATRLRACVDSLYSGDLIFAAPTRPWRREIDRVSDRLVLKITSAKAVMPWFDQNFDSEIVYLTRHPVAQSLSCIRNGWRLTTPAYLRDADFVGSWLANDEGWVRDLSESGSELEQWVLNWCLENLVPLRSLDSHPGWVHLRYEDCVTDPTTTLDRLARLLDLDDVETMAGMISRPSQSSNLSTETDRSLIASGAVTTDRWKHEVAPDEAAAAARIVERLRFPDWVFES